MVVFVPAGTDVGLNCAVAAAGSPLAVNVTEPRNAPPTGAVEIVKFVDWPAVTVCCGVVLATEKSVMVKLSEFDVPPPGAGFTTVTAAVPEAAMSPAGIAAVNCVEFTKVVVRAVPFHCATELAMKFVPLSVSVNAAPPAPAEEGTSDVRVGTGFAALIVNVSGLDVTPDGAPAGTAALTEPKTTVGVKTVTDAVPAF